jgi:hypothetical protein
MGMFYATEEYVEKLSNSSEEGCGYRDRERIKKMEDDMNFTIYSVDIDHDPLKCEDKRHYKGRFDHPDFIRELRLSLPIHGEIYLALFDFYHVFESWLESNWKSHLFKDVIPGIFISRNLNFLRYRYETCQDCGVNCPGMG